MARAAAAGVDPVALLNESDPVKHQILQKIADRADDLRREGIDRLAQAIANEVVSRF